MTRFAVALLGVVGLACTAPAPGPGTPRLDGARVLAHVAAQVAIGPRPGDTPASRETLAWIERQLPRAGTRLGVGTVELPEIRVLGTVHRARHIVATTDENLVLRFGPPARGDALLVMAHYDTVDGSPGAVDNAAAVGVLIELARTLDAAPPAQPVILAFTANEERGLVGAEALARAIGDDVAFAISLDLVGAAGPLVVNGASELVGAAELGWLAAAATAAGVTVRVPLAHRVVSRWWPQSERSDHGPFTRRGVRAVHLYHRGQDGEHVDLAYHSPRDTLARVQRAAVDELGRLLVALVARPIPAPGRAGFWLPAVANVVVPHAAVVAGELVLAVVALALIVRRPPRRSQRRGLGIGAAIAGYAVAVAATIAIARLLASAHPLRWLHAPAHTTVGIALLLVGGTLLLSRLGARFAPWVGERRYLVVAVAVPLAVGAALLAIDAPELAWIWLVPAAVTAIGARPGVIGAVRWLAPLVQLMPGVLVLAPAQLREAAWHGFWPLGIPLALWVGVLAAPPIATVAWLLRRRQTPSGPLGTLVLPVGCALVTAVGFWLLLRAPTPCSAAQFHDFHLACEALREVR